MTNITKTVLVILLLAFSHYAVYTVEKMRPLPVLKVYTTEDLLGYPVLNLKRKPYVPANWKTEYSSPPSELDFLVMLVLEEEE